MMKKRMFMLLLSALMLAQFTACSETTTDDGTASGDTAAAPSVEEETAAETTEEDILNALLAEVPGGDYGGHAFTMLNNESNFAYTLMTAEELTGEGINDAIYNRNVAVAEKLNIKISENMVAYSQVTTDMNNCIAATF